MAAVVYAAPDCPARTEIETALEEIGAGTDMVAVSSPGDLPRPYRSRLSSAVLVDQHKVFKGVDAILEYLETVKHIKGLV